MLTPSRLSVRPSTRRRSPGLPTSASLALAAAGTEAQSTGSPAPYTGFEIQSARQSLGLSDPSQVAGSFRRCGPLPPAVLSRRLLYTRRPRSRALRLSWPSKRAVGRATTL